MSRKLTEVAGRLITQWRSAREERRELDFMMARRRTAVALSQMTGCSYREALKIIDRSRAYRSALQAEETGK